ncbi:AraC family transcriptional regulator [Paenibacillus rigui]|uniref:HTH araC/xylS-type domain-containing protein n=1 Tax=Paenibacillus rigui TaxID=554312 RepID=A0A229UR79_9BACL|nr:AraC family transcriptional regulator [Paenibacillus rigui]OXM85399.1 hypothetical protein CF651_15400 [Paenibacillus rigui]
MLRPFPARHTLFSKLWKGHTREQAIDVTPAADYLEQAFDVYDQVCLHGGGVADEERMMLVLQIMHGISFVKEHIFRTETADGRTRPLNYAETMMQWIEEHYSEDIQLEDIANALHLSKFYVSRLFQDETGGTIKQYLTARRIKQACRLLQTTALPVEQIGAEVGIPNASYFIRLFKRVVGTTPLKYRRK